MTYKIKLYFSKFWKRITHNVFLTLCNSEINLVEVEAEYRVMRCERRKHLLEADVM